MKKLLLILATLIPLIALGQPGEKNFIDQNYIEVTGKSEMEITPDRIYLRVILNEKDTKNKVSVPELETQMVDKLKEIGIDVDKNLFIKDITSNFKFYLLAKKDIFLSKEYQVVVTDGKTASRVFVELEKIGISNVSIEKLDHSKMEEFRKETKVNAIKSAKQKAEFLAIAVDQNIGKALYIQELDNFGQFPRTTNSIMIRGKSSMYGSKAELDVDFEKIKIEYSILCRFELK
ncbi:MAG: SIMPL domain-containing protein [Bacteroidales bacterium]|nr:SIMPL domain-containing protein [Bacteroidales bacterium]